MERIMVSEIAKQIRGVSYKPENLHDTLDSNAVVLLRANNIDDGKINFDDVVYIDKSKVSQEQYLQKGDILACASSGSKQLVGKAASVDFDGECTFGAFCKVVRPIPEMADYLGAYFQSSIYRNKMSEVAIGVNINNIRNEHIAALDVPIRTPAENAKVVQIINLLQVVIDHRKIELQKLDDLVKARFVEMFGDCLANPKGWKTVCLEDIAEVGSSKRVFVEELKKDGIPFYRGTEIGALAEGKQIIPELFITDTHYAELVEATGTPQKGDLLMPSICPDGRIWLVDTDKPFYFKDGRVLWVHAIANNYNPVFLLYTLKDRIVTDYSSIASGTTFAELKIFALKKCRVFDVPVRMQNRFDAFVAQVDKSKVAEPTGIMKGSRYLIDIENADRRFYDDQFRLSETGAQIQQFFRCCHCSRESPQD